MSDDLQTTLTNLVAENEDLKNKAAQNSHGVEALLAQLDAYKGIMNESLSSSITLRTNLVLLQKQSEKLADRNAALQRQVESLNQQLSDATKRIAELENPVSLNKSTAALS